MVDMISGTVEKTNNGQTITETFSVSEAGVSAVRKEIPLGVSGQPIYRIPKNPRLVGLLESGVIAKRIQGIDRCLRLVTLPLEGGTEGEFHCSATCVSQGVDSEAKCPEHDREAFKPNQSHPPRPGRTFNSASIALSEAEKQVVFTDKEGKKQVATLEEGRDIGAIRSGTKLSQTDSIAQLSVVPDSMRGSPGIPVKRRKRSDAGKVRNTGRDNGSSLLAVKLDISTWDKLDSDSMVYQVLQAVIGSLDNLPAKTIADMKRVVAIQDKLKDFTLEEGK